MQHCVSLSPSHLGNSEHLATSHSHSHTQWQRPHRWLKLVYDFLYVRMYFFLFIIIFILHRHVSLSHCLPIVASCLNLSFIWIPFHQSYYNFIIKSVMHIRVFLFFSHRTEHGKMKLFQNTAVSCFSLWLFFKWLFSMYICFTLIIILAKVSARTYSDLFKI